MKRLLLLSFVIGLMSTASYGQEYSIEGKSLQDEDVQTVALMGTYAFGNIYFVIDSGDGYKQLWKDGQKAKFKQMTSIFGVIGKLGFTFKGSAVDNTNQTFYVFEKKLKKE